MILEESDLTMANFPSRDREMNRRNGSGATQPMDADTMSSLSTRRLLASAAEDNDWDVPRLRGRDGSVSDEENARMLSASRGTDPAKAAHQEKIELLRAENEELRALAADLRKQVDEAVGQTQDAFAKREEEFEAQLEEKSEELRTLFIRIQESERGQANAAAEHAASPAGRQDEERAAMWEDIQREHQAWRKNASAPQEERRQLRDDEENMMQRMREMELQVSKSRTEMVRQRNELQQLHNEVRANWNGRNRRAPRWNGSARSANSTRKFPRVAPADKPGSSTPKKRAVSTASR